MVLPVVSMELKQIASARNTDTCGRWRSKFDASPTQARNVRQEHERQWKVVLKVRRFPELCHGRVAGCLEMRLERGGVGMCLEHGSQQFQQLLPLLLTGQFSNQYQ